LGDEQNYDDEYFFIRMMINCWLTNQLTGQVKVIW